MINSINLSSTCFDQPSVHPQEDLYNQCYGIFHAFVSAVWLTSEDPDIDQTV